MCLCYCFTEVLLWNKSTSACAFKASVVRPDRKGRGVQSSEVNICLRGKSQAPEVSCLWSVCTAVWFQTSCECGQTRIPKGMLGLYPCPIQTHGEIEAAAAKSNILCGLSGNLRTLWLFPLVSPMYHVPLMVAQHTAEWYLTQVASRLSAIELLKLETIKKTDEFKIKTQHHNLLQLHAVITTHNKLLFQTFLSWLYALFIS